MREKQGWVVASIILLVLFIASIAVGFYSYNSKDIQCKEKTCEKYELEDKALLAVELYD